MIIPTAYADRSKWSAAKLILNLRQSKSTMGGDQKALLTAAETGDLTTVKYYLHQGIDPNQEHPEAMTTPLLESVRNGQLAVATYLLKNGAD
ncbi:MAG: ankyrin repeat domain-containing protein, partial [Bacteroidota bacterium]